VVSAIFLLVNLQFPSNAQLDEHSFMCYTIKFVAHFCIHFAYYQILNTTDRLISALSKQVSDETMAERIRHLREEVSGMFQACKNVVDKTNLVDVVQRLGIDHHFEEQIATALASIHSAEFNSSSSLHEAALRFRLLRQQGFWVPAGTVQSKIRSYKN
jgi:hypothetical protein